MITVLDRCINNNFSANLKKKPGVSALMTVINGDTVVLNSVKVLQLSPCELTSFFHALFV